MEQTCSENLQLGRLVADALGEIERLGYSRRSRSRYLLRFLTMRGVAEKEHEGDRPGAAWTLLNLGVTGGLAKMADDGTQLILEAILSTATDVSTAGTSRIVSACVSGVFMLTRHGRDVVLPKFTEMEITFSRPVVRSAGAPSAVADNAQSKIGQ